MHVRIAFAVALASSVAVGAGGCAKKPAPVPPEPRALTIGLEVPIRSLDPATDDTVAWSIVGNVFEGLVGMGPDLAVVPLLAQRWTNPDDLTWLFELRPGVRFHDGSLLDAEAVRAGLDRVRSDRDSPARLWLAAISSIEAVEAGRLRIRTKRPDPLLLLHLAQVPIARGGSSAEIDRRPIGTGAYRVSARSPERIELVAWEGWRGPPVRVPRLSVVVVGEGEPAVAALDAGRVDLAAVPLRAVVSAPNRVWRWSAAEGLSVLFLWVDSLSRGAAPNPFADVRVRRALSLAVDRRAVARAATGHDDTAASQLVSRTLFGFDEGVGVPVADPAAARRLLTLAGFPKGLDTEVTYRSTAITRPAVESLVAHLAEAGFRVRPREMGFQESLVPYREGARALFVDAWTFDVPDASSFLQDCIRTRDDGAGVGLLNPGFSDPEIDRLVDESVATLDPAMRSEMLKRVLALAAERVPAVPLFTIPRIWGLSRDLAWRARLDNRLFGAEMTFRVPPTPQPARSPGPAARP